MGGGDGERGKGVMEAEGRGGSDGGRGEGRRDREHKYCNANNLNKDDYRGP